MVATVVLWLHFETSVDSRSKAGTSKKISVNMIGHSKDRQRLFRGNHEEPVYFYL